MLAFIINYWSLPTESEGIDMRRRLSSFAGRSEGLLLMGILLLQVLVVSAACGGSSDKKVSGTLEGIAQSVEKTNVQGAFNLLIADAFITVIDAKQGSRTAAVNDWTGLPTRGGSAIQAGGSNVDLGDYTEMDVGDTTQYWYCYDTVGRVIEQRTTAGNCS